MKWDFRPLLPFVASFYTAHSLSISSSSSSWSFSLAMTLQPILGRGHSLTKQIFVCNTHPLLIHKKCKTTYTSSNTIQQRTVQHILRERNTVEGGERANYLSFCLRKLVFSESAAEECQTITQVHSQCQKSQAKQHQNKTKQEQKIQIPICRVQINCWWHGRIFNSFLKGSSTG